MYTPRLFLLGFLLFPILASPTVRADPDEDRNTARSLRRAGAVPYGKTAPEGAVSLEPEEFLAGVEDGTLQPFGPLTALRDVLRTRAQMREDRDEARRLFDPDLLRRHTASPPAWDPRYRPLPDGNVAYRVGSADPRTGEGEQWVILQGNAYNFGELVQAHQAYFDRTNQQGVYKALFDSLDADFIRRNALPDPALTKGLSFEQIEALNDAVASQWPAFALPGIGKPPGYPPNAAAEEGAGYGGDSATQTTPSGLASTAFYPLRWCTTSVKSQGLRGTCTAFAITGAVEATIAAQSSRWVNLSEQMLFNRAKQVWVPSHYGDGLHYSTTMNAMLFYTYRFSWEATWDYNPSPFRLDLAFLYIDSCIASIDEDTQVETPYAGELCSETNHQATAYCTALGTQYLCAASDAAQDIAPDAQFRITGYLPIHVAGNSVHWAKAFLALKRPVMLSVTVPPTGMDREVVELTNGYVNFDPSDLGASGSHAMLLVGYVPNTALPPGAPPATGEGYFICKNSWGPTYGDGGFLYLDDVWVWFWSKGMYVLQNVVE